MKNFSLGSRFFFFFNNCSTIFHWETAPRFAVRKIFERDIATFNVAGKSNWVGLLFSECFLISNIWFSWYSPRPLWGRLVQTQNRRFWASFEKFLEQTAFIFMIWEISHVWPPQPQNGLVQSIQKSHFWNP